MSSSHVPSSGRDQRPEAPAGPQSGPDQPAPPRQPDRDPHARHDRDPHARHDRDPHARHDRDIPQAGRRARRGPSTRARIEAKMSSRAALRDAFLLHEVLGPPAALREPGPRAPGG